MCEVKYTQKQLNLTSKIVVERTVVSRFSKDSLHQLTLLLKTSLLIILKRRLQAMINTGIHVGHASKHGEWWSGVV